MKAIKRALLLVLILTVSSILSEPLISVYQNKANIGIDIIKDASDALLNAEGVKNIITDPNKYQLNNPTDKSVWTITSYKVTDMKKMTSTPNPSLDFTATDFVLKYNAQNEDQNLSVDFSLNVQYFKPASDNIPEQTGNAVITLKASAPVFTLTQRNAKENLSFNLENIISVDSINISGVTITPDKKDSPTNGKENEFLLLFSGNSDVSLAIFNKVLEEYSIKLTIEYKRAWGDGWGVIKFQNSNRKNQIISLIYDSNFRIVDQNTVIEYYTGDIKDNANSNPKLTLPNYVSSFEDFDPKDGDYQIFISDKLFANVMADSLSDFKNFNIYNIPNQNGYIQLSVKYLSKFMPDIANYRHLDDILTLEYNIDSIDYTENDLAVFKTKSYIMSISDLNIHVELDLDLALQFTPSIEANSGKIFYKYGGNINKIDNFSIENMFIDAQYQVTYPRRFAQEVINAIVNKLYSTSADVILDGLNIGQIVTGLVDFTSAKKVQGGVLISVETTSKSLPIPDPVPSPPTPKPDPNTPDKPEA